MQQQPRGIKRASSLAEIRERQRKRTATPENRAVAASSVHGNTSTSLAAAGPSRISTSSSSSGHGTTSTKNNSLRRAATTAGTVSTSSKPAAVPITAFFQRSRSSRQASASANASGANRTFSASASTTAPRLESQDTVVLDGALSSTRSTPSTSPSTSRSRLLGSDAATSTAPCPAPGPSKGPAAPSTSSFPFVIARRQPATARPSNPFQLLSQIGRGNDSDDDGFYDDLDEDGEDEPVAWSDLIKRTASLQVHGASLPIACTESAFRDGVVDDVLDEGDDDGLDDDDAAGDGWMAASLSEWESDAEDDDSEDGEPDAWPPFDSPAAVDGDGNDDDVPMNDDDPSTSMDAASLPNPASDATDTTLPFSWTLPQQISFQSSTSLEWAAPAPPTTALGCSATTLDSFTLFQHASPLTTDSPAIRFDAQLYHYRHPGEDLSPASRAARIKQTDRDELAYAQRSSVRWQAAFAHAVALVQNGDMPYLYFIHRNHFTAVVLPDRAFVTGCTRGLRAQFAARGITVETADRGSARDVAGDEKPKRVVPLGSVVPGTGDSDDDNEEMDDLPWDNGTGALSGAAADVAPIRTVATAHLSEPAHATVVVPFESRVKFVAFLGEFLEWNASSARVLDPSLPVLVAPRPFLHASLHKAQMTRVGTVSSVHGAASRIQVEGWVLPPQVQELVALVREHNPDARVQVVPDTHVVFPARMALGQPR
ncbi:hypothetical protein AMAG_10234 [Allomyces macrogynus ATCC 38327]|uniref:Uncharacterized protein n=1 Tax=Allomyces macrogynus (strain ATCC 38327) TaxID=578462 RepID=A0A0L0STT9_ALLM3|nr:hypothetical protein AMAG_10234 [Allomyces macrogynus ATCC 38327]|eukprot:KNE65947.1 hypothetical protein AMAG_10234 [Allomyces macrogynus ATCC 38327]